MDDIRRERRARAWAGLKADLEAQLPIFAATLAEAVAGDKPEAQPAHDLKAKPTYQQHSSWSVEPSAKAVDDIPSGQRADLALLVVAGCEPSSTATPLVGAEDDKPEAQPASPARRATVSSRLCAAKLAERVGVCKPEARRAAFSFAEPSRKRS